MNNNYELVATATKGLELTNVDKVKLNEALTLTDNNDIKAICTSVAKVLSMSNVMDYTLCKAYASIRLALKDEKNLSFKKWCEINDKDVSNTNKYATVWDKFYSDIPDKDGVSPRSLFADKGINILDYTPSFLSTFNARTTADVVLLFVNVGVTPDTTCKQARELNKCFEHSTTQGTILNTSKAIDIMNGVNTKDEKKSDEKKSDKKTEENKSNDNIWECIKEYSTNDLMNIFKTIIGEKENKEITDITIKFADGKTKKF